MKEMVKRISSGPGFNTLQVRQLPVVDEDVVNLDFFNTNQQTVLSWKDNVKDKDLTTPPGAPTVNDRYIIASVATGAWLARENDIAQWNGSSWDIFTTIEGDATYVDDENLIYLFNGTSWVSLGSATSHNTLSGLDGGTSGEYFHFTSAQHVDLTSGDPTFGTGITVGNIRITSNTLSSTSGDLIIDSATSDLLLGDITIARNVATSLVSIKGGTSASSNTELSMFGETHATLADLTVLKGATINLNDETDATRFSTSSAGNVLGAVVLSRDVANSLVSFTGGSQASGIAQLVMWGESHATLPNRTHLRGNPISFRDSADAEVAQLTTASGSVFLVDTINELTSANGVVIDSVTMKDGGISGTGTTFVLANANSGGNVCFDVTNSSNTANSDSLFRAFVAGTSGGDPCANFVVLGGGSQMSIGLDNSDGDAIKITNNATPSFGTEVFKATQAGAVSIPNLTVSSGDFNITSGELQIGGTAVLTSSALGSGITSSSLTSVGSSLLVTGSITADGDGDTCLFLNAGTTTTSEFKICTGAATDNAIYIDDLESTFERTWLQYTDGQIYMCANAKSGVANQYEFRVNGTGQGLGSGDLAMSISSSGETKILNDNFKVIRSSSGGEVFQQVRNESNTAGSNAAIFMECAGGSGGDPYIQFFVTGGATRSFGIDNSDSDKLKLTTGANPSSGTVLFDVDTTGFSIASGGLEIGGATVINSSRNATFDTGLTFGATSDASILFTTGGLSNEIIRWDDTGTELIILSKVIIGGAETNAFKVNQSGHCFMENLRTEGGGELNVSVDASTGELVQASSSLRNKSRVKDINVSHNTDDILSRITAKSFKYKSSGRPDIGFIAEDFVGILDEVVCFKGKDVQGLRYDRLTAVLWNEVKRLRGELKKLRQEFDDFKKPRTDPSKFKESLDDRLARIENNQRVQESRSNKEFETRLSRLEANMSSVLRRTRR